jgi:uncharacterized phage-associated protein
MSHAIDVARFLIHLAAPREDEDIDCLSHLRLHKLLYYAQGWHLAIFGRPLFGERIEAWTHGPVVKDVYPEFKAYGYKAIPPSEGADPAELTDEARELVRGVWHEYGRYSAGALRDMTRGESPWKEARAGLAEDAASDREITPDRLQSFFLSQSQSRLVPGIDPASGYRAAEELKRGGGVSLDAALTGLRSRV